MLGAGILIGLDFVVAPLLGFSPFPADSGEFSWLYSTVSGFATGLLSVGSLSVIVGLRLLKRDEHFYDEARRYYEVSKLKAPEKV